MPAAAPHPPLLRQAVLALGSNLQPRDWWLDQGTATLVAEGGRALRLTPRWNTRTVGGPPQPDYLNQLLLLEGRLDGRGWLRVAQLAESLAGRRRSVLKGPRRLDVDVILVEAEEVATPDLVIPHPALLERAYLLAGAASLVPLWIVGREGLSLLQLAEQRLPPLWASPRSLTAAAGRPGRE